MVVCLVRLSALTARRDTRTLFSSCARRRSSAWSVDYWSPLPMISLSSIPADHTADHEEPTE
jgi:hypothetical protein